MRASRLGRGILFMRWIARQLLAIPRPLAWIPPVAWGTAIWMLSSKRVDLGRLPELGFIPLVGNLFHAFEFGVLALLCLPMLPRKDSWVDFSGGFLRVLAGVCIVFGFLDEWHQSWVPGRSASLLDWGTDVVGIAASLIMAQLLGNPELTRARFYRSICIAFLCCLVAAGLATLWDGSVASGPWPFGEDL